MASAPSEDFDLEGALVPLLDLVLQLVMFFMIVANFVMEQVNETIRLPEATSAKSLDKDVRDLLFVNINEQGHILRTDGDAKALTNKLEFQFWFKNQYRDALTRASLDAKNKGEVDTMVIFRAHRSTKFEHLHDVMEACRAAGFKKIQFRAIMKMED